MDNLIFSSAETCSVEVNHMHTAQLQFSFEVRFKIGMRFNKYSP